MISEIADSIVSNPRSATVLGLIITVVLWRVQRVGPARAVVFDRVRRALAVVLNRPARRFFSFPLLRDKTGRDDEAIAVVETGRAELLRVLWDAGFRWNPVSRVKYRDLDDGRRQYALSLSHLESVTSPWQQDIHIFPRPHESGYRILGHWEPSPTDPEAHLGGEDQKPGDPKEVVREALKTADIDFSAA